MNGKRFNRRDFIKASAIGTAAAALAACAPQEVVVTKEVVVTQEVEVTKEVEKEVNRNGCTRRKTSQLELLQPGW